MYVQQLSMIVAGGVTEVKTDIFVTSFGPVSDVDMVRCRACPGTSTLCAYCAEHDRASVTTRRLPYGQSAMRPSNEL